MSDTDTQCSNIWEGSARLNAHLSAKQRSQRHRKCHKLYSAKETNYGTLLVLERPPESPDLKSIKSLWTWRWPRSNKHSFNWNVSSFITFSRSKCQMHSNNKFKVSKCSVTFSSIYPFGEHTSTLPEMGNVIIVNYILTFFYSKNSDWNDCRDIQSYVKRCVNKSKQKRCFRELS